MDRKVMIVDDDPGVRISVSTIFKKAEIEICSAEGGAQCLEHLRSGFTGLILLDIMMPEMDGWDTIRELAKEGFAAKVMILMLTAKDEPGQKMEGLQEMVVDYITKPFDPADLVETVKDMFTYFNG